MKQSNSKLDDFPEMISMDVIAEYLKVSKPTAKSWLEDNNITIFKIGKMLRVKKDDFKQLLKL